jgi:hypothetical protein
VENVTALIHFNYRLFERELIQANAAGLVVELIEILIVITLGSIFRQQFLKFFSPFSLFVITRPCNILALLLLNL